MYKTFILALVLCAFSAFAGEPMTDAEKSALVAHLEKTSANFQKSIEGVSEAQWHYKAAPDRWSLAECSEHIIAAESFIRGAIGGALKEPAAAELLKDARKDAMIETIVLDRSKKFQAPEQLKPTDKKFATPADAIAAFQAERAKTIELAQQSGDLRSYAAAHPAAGTLDAYSWFIFLSSHTGRHTLQIDEVKADANYPR
jgi:hypothetical protein